MLIYCRAGTRPVIDLDLFYAPVRPHAKTERSQKAPQPGCFFGVFFLFPRDKLKTVEEASVSLVGGSRQGTLQQLVWIIRGVGGSWLEELEGRRGDSWRQDRASRSGRMTITKTLAGSRSPAERGCSWLAPLTATGWAGEWTTVGGVCVWETEREREREREREGRSYFHFLWDSPFLSLRNAEKHLVNDCEVERVLLSVNTNRKCVRVYRSPELAHSVPTYNKVLFGQM